MENREPIGHVTATVQFPLYEGDKLEGTWDWFEYREPGITPDGEIGVCERKCEVLSANVSAKED